MQKFLIAYSSNRKEAEFGTEQPLRLEKIHQTVPWQ